MENTGKMATARNRELDLNRKVGAAIRHFREYHGISQEGLASELGVSFAQIQKIEYGENRCSAGRLIMACDFFKVSLLDFMLKVTSIEIPSKRPRGRPSAKQT